MDKLALPLAALLALAGCVSTPTQVSVKGETMPAISGISMSCSKPYPITQDCSGLSGAALKVEHDGFRFKIAGSADGRLVFAMPLPLTPDLKESEQVYDAVSAVAARAGAKLEKVEAVAAGSLVAGFVFTFDRDVYAALRAKPAPK